MKDCDHYINMFSDLLDDTIDANSKIQLQSHLNDCPDCQAQLDDLRSMKKSLASLPRLKTSTSFDTVLYAQIRQEERFKRSRTWSFSFFEFGWKAPAYAVVAIFLMFLGAQLQRYTSVQSSYATFDKNIAIENALNGEMNFVDPGYLVVADVDSVKNTVRVVNYPDVDRAATIEDYEKSRNRLPDLREAPVNQARVTQSSRSNQPQIRQAEFVF